MLAHSHAHAMHAPLSHQAHASPDGLKLLVGTATGTVGVLDVPSQTEHGGSGVHLTHELRKPVCDYMEQQHHEAKKRTQQ